MGKKSAKKKQKLLDKYYLQNPRLKYKNLFTKYTLKIG